MESASTLLEAQVKVFTNEGSGWIVYEILDMELKIAAYYAIKKTVLAYSGILKKP